MGLRKRLFIVFTGIIAVFAAISVFAIANLTLLGKHFDEIRGRSIAAQAITAETVNCVSRFEDAVALFLVEANTANAAKIHDLRVLCAQKIENTRPYTRNVHELDTLKQIIEDFAKTSLDLGTNNTDAINQLITARNRFETLSARFRRTGALGEMISQISREIMSKPMMDTPFDERATSEYVKILSTQKSPELRKSAAALSTLTAGWNIMMERRRSKYEPLHKEILSIPSRVGAMVLADSVSAAENIRLSVRNSTAITNIVFGAVILLLSLIFRWILKSWSASLGSLKTFAQKIVAGESAEMPKFTETEDANDEVAVATQALMSSFNELAIQKQNLEQNIEERSKKLAETQQQLAHSERLAGLGTMAAGIAHELNNPLQVITLATEQLAPMAVESEKNAKNIDRISKQAERMRCVISQLKKLARNDRSSQITVTSLDKIVENSMLLISQKLKNESVALEVEIDSLLSLHADTTKLESVLSNLVGNAIDAFEKIPLAERDRRIKISSELTDFGSLLINVEDNGSGIPDNTKQKIFEPFFTTKDVGKGTGLGLSLCFKIIKELGGELYFKTMVGSGTTFTIEFPRECLSPAQEKAA